MAKRYPRINEDGEMLVRDQAITDAIAEEAVLDVTTTLLLGDLVRVSIEFTRPADLTGYTARDVVCNSTSAPALLVLANLARANDVGGYLVGLRLATDKKSITPRFRVHFYRATDPTLVNDNAVKKSLYVDEAKTGVYIDLPAMQTSFDATNSDMSFAQDMTIRVPFIPGSGGKDIYAQLETLDSFVPASAQKFTLTAWADQN